MQDPKVLNDAPKQDTQAPKQPYDKPKIIYRAPLEALAGQCLIGTPPPQGASGKADITHCTLVTS